MAPTQIAKYREAIGIRQSKVENDSGKMRRRERVGSRSRSLHHIGVEAGGGERFGEKQRQFLIVFDDQQSHCPSP